jgi:hypothetical protein
MPQSLTTNKTAIREAVVTLLRFIESSSSFSINILDHFPSPQEKFNFPAVTIAAKAPKFSPVMPYVISKTDPVEIGVPPDPDAPNRVATVRRVVGAYDFAFQMDLWSAYKPQRDSLMEEMIKIFNQDADVPGISLQLTDYFDEWIHFSLSNIKYMEDEASSQRGEWRALVEVVGNCRCVLEKVEHVFETIENTLETPATIPSPSPDEGELII